MNLCQHHSCRKPIPIGGRSHRIYCSVRCGQLAATKRRRQKIKRKAFEYCGSKCADCKYDNDEYLEVYDFHHLDSDEKDLAVSQSYTMSWSRLVKELDRCVMLCARCHRIRHAIMAHQAKMVGAVGFEPTMDLRRQIKSLLPSTSR